MTRTEPAGGVKVAVVKVVPAFLTLAGVEGSNDKLAAAAGGVTPTTMPMSTRALLATNTNGARTMDLIAVLLA